jgi:hypothetical protein
LIRLDDLIPKQDVTGGHQLLFGDTTQTTQQKKTNMQGKKKKNIKVRDLKPSKDAKGGGHGGTKPKVVDPGG